jgi:predicted HD phosphohydrolase
MNEQTPTVKFTEMKHGTRDEYLMLREMEQAHVKLTPDRILKALRDQQDETIEGYKITRLQHGLQSATRAWRDGADIDWVVGAVLHDIGDGLAPQNHDEFAAAIVRPFLREEVTWCVHHHGAFQMVYYAHHYDWNQFEREKFAGEPYFQSCVDFCEFWDQASFDPDYDTLPLEFFEPMIRDVFARHPYAEATVQPGVKSLLRDQAVAAQRAAN